MVTTQAQVLVSVSEGVMTLTLNRPEKLNAVTYRMIAELLDQLQRAEEDGAVRAVAMTGAGRAFSAGDDVVSMGELPYQLPPGAHPVREYQQRLIMRWFWFPKPTIAAIRGRCHGIAQDLALAADFRIVSETTVFGDMRAKRAVPVGSGATFLLPRMIGLPAATRLLLTGDTIDAHAMDRLGLVTELVEDVALEEAAQAFARRMAAGPTKALGIIKHEMRSNLSCGLEEALERELSLLDEPVEDREEGRRSFAERREPVYTGR